MPNPHKLVLWLFYMSLRITGFFNLTINRSVSDFRQYYSLEFRIEGVFNEPMRTSRIANSTVT